MKGLFFFFLYLLLSPVANAQPANLIKAHEAIEHVGEYAVACGVIASTSYRKNSKGSPTYLNDLRVPSADEVLQELERCSSNYPECPK